MWWYKSQLFCTKQCFGGQRPALSNIKVQVYFGKSTPWIQFNTLAFNCFNRKLRPLLLIVKRTHIFGTKMTNLIENKIAYERLLEVAGMQQ